MFADKVIINRRNVNTDVSRKVDGCKKFFLLEVHARIIAAFCEILNVSSLDDCTSDNSLLQNIEKATKREKQEILKRISEKVVDTFIVRDERNSKIIEQQAHEDWLVASNKRNEDGEYLCRYADCTQTFKLDGKRRIDHKKRHSLHKEIAVISSTEV